MPKRPARLGDLNQLAKLILDVATGEAENAKPVTPKAGQRKGDLRGGKTRAKTLSAGARRKIAKRAGLARWGKR